MPVAVEIGLRPVGDLHGAEAAPKVEDAWILGSGGYATWRAGGDSIRIGPGLRQHAYTQIRGAEPKPAGPALYLCGYTPFDHSFTLE